MRRNEAGYGLILWGCPIRSRLCWGQILARSEQQDTGAWRSFWNGLTQYSVPTLLRLEHNNVYDIIQLKEKTLKVFQVSF